MQEFIVAFSICTTVGLFLLVAVRRIRDLISLVVKHDASIMFSFSERRGSDNKLPIQRDLSHTNIVIVLGHAVQTYVSGLCCFYIITSRVNLLEKMAIGRVYNTRRSEVGLGFSHCLCCLTSAGL